MAAADLKTALLIALQTTGEERVAKLRQALVDLGISADKAEDLAAGLDTELKQIADSAEKAGNKAGKSSVSIADLANQIAGLATAGAVMKFAKDSVDAFGRAEAAFRGLESQAKHSGVSIGTAMDVANRLAADGLVSVADASKALQNLLSRGYSIDQAEATLTRLKDAASFNRQATLSMSEAVLSATEGLKNENSVLVDNAGVTKNVAKMWEEYAKAHNITAQEMTQAQKIQAEYNGIMKETEAQVGNAAKAMEGYQGQAAKAEQATNNFKVQLGQILAPTAGGLAEGGVWLIESFFKPIVFHAQRTGVEIGLFAAQIDTIFEAIKNADFTDLGKKMDANIALAEEAMIDYAKRLDGNTLSIAEQAREAEKLGKAGKQAGKDMADGADEMTAGMGALKAALNPIPAAVNNVEEAYKTLGIQSQAALDVQSAKTREAYELIKTSGATVQQVNQAWAKYAETAIAANGGIADSTIQAEAAARGYKIEIDDTGKAVLRLKNVVDDLGKSLTYSGDAMSRLPADLNGGIGNMTERLGQWSRDIEAIGTGMSWHINTMRKEFEALGPAAAETFETMLGGARDVFGAGGLLTTGPASPLAQMRDKMSQVTETAEQLTEKLNSSAVSAGDVTSAMGFLNASTLSGYRNIHALGEERARPLLDALEQAKRRLDDLRDAAADTLSSLRDEMDELNANYDDIERRRAEAREADLRAQLAAAKASGDRQAIGDLEESLRLLKAITAERIKEAELRETAEKTTTTATASGGTSTTTSSTTSSTASRSSGVNLTIHVSGPTDAAALARLIVPEIDKITRWRA